MTLPSTAELARNRADAQAFLMSDTCSILAITTTSDGEGGITESETTSSSGVACRIDYAGGREIALGGKLQPFYGHVITLPWGTVITDLNIVLIGSTRYGIVAVDSAQSMGTAVIVYAEKRP